MWVPRLEWTAVSRGNYRVTWHRERWALRATPDAKHPWLLPNGVAAQEIGAAAVHDAMSQAETWLETGQLIPHSESWQP
jgi:hypothetical protein